jgi:hypothetical protein
MKGRSMLLKEERDNPLAFCPRGVEVKTTSALKDVLGQNVNNTWESHKGTPGLALELAHAFALESVRDGHGEKLVDADALHG